MSQRKRGSGPSPIYHAELSIAQAEAGEPIIREHFACLASQNWDDPTQPCPNVNKAFEQANNVKGGGTVHVLHLGTYTGQPLVKHLYLDKSKRTVSFAKQDREQEDARDLRSSLKTTSANPVKFEVQKVKAKHTLDELTKRQVTDEQKQRDEDLIEDNGHEGSQC